MDLIAQQREARLTHYTTEATKNLHREVREEVLERIKAHLPGADLVEVAAAMEKGTAGYRIAELPSTTQPMGSVFEHDPSRYKPVLKLVKPGEELPQDAVGSQEIAHLFQRALATRARALDAQGARTPRSGVQDDELKAKAETLAARAVAQEADANLALRLGNAEGMRDAIVRYLDRAGVSVDAKTLAAIEAGLKADAGACGLAIELRRRPDGRELPVLQSWTFPDAAPEGAHAAASLDAVVKRVRESEAVFDRAGEQAREALERTGGCPLGLRARSESSL